MLCRLLVVRHAKSAWDSDANTDHERPLNKRGRKDAPRVAAELLRRDWVPRWVVSSDSVRTTQTWELMRAAFEGANEQSADGSAYAATVMFRRDLYHASLMEVRQALLDLNLPQQVVMVLGHNPGWEDMVSVLTGEYVTMTTCNAALLSVEADDWQQAMLLESCWHLHHLVRPREL